MKLDQSDFYNVSALEDRLTDGLKASGRPVRFLVGSAVSAAPSSDVLGVLPVDGVIELIRADFSGSKLSELDALLAAGGNRYQSAFQFLVGRRGQAAANNIVKRAVLASRQPLYSSTNQPVYQPTADLPDDLCANYERDVERWSLPPAVAALGKLAATHPEQFGQHILTTNFDPLIGVAIDKEGGQFMRTVVHRDGDLGQTSGKGCHVIHCHGYWYGSDTLHTPRQLGQSRPRLEASLSHILGQDLLVVCGYGGWDDVITKTLLDVALDDRVSPEIAWTFYGDDPQPHEQLLRILAPGIERGRVTLYKGVDCHKFLPRIAEVWGSNDRAEGRAPRAVRPSTRPATPGPAIAPELKRPSGKLFFDNHDRDCPPDADFFVGRDAELRSLEKNRKPVPIITGIGGQGKSLLAAAYFNGTYASQQFRYRIWRDCREQSDRFERQIANIISALSRGQVSATELANQPMTSLAELFVRLIGDDRFLFVFDNVDHYVDLEGEFIGGAPGTLIEALSSVNNGSQFLFTCRPEIKPVSDDIYHQRISGLSLESTVALFAARSAPSEPAEIEEAHALTDGHALWLDLMAAQVAKRSPDLVLSDLLFRAPRAARGEMPEETLQVIWDLLSEDERLVMRAMAEIVRSSTENEIINIVRGLISFTKLHKAVSSLHSQSLVVTKANRGFQRLVELHPVLRTFVRRRFTQAERVPFIEALVRSLLALIGANSPLNSSRPSMERLQPYIDMAELHIEAGDYAKAFAALEEIRWPMKSSTSPGEYVRVSRRLLSEIDWNNFEDYEGSETVFQTTFEMSTRLGRVEECHSLLERYLSTIDGKSARYIQYCDLQCYFHWVNENYRVAIEWGEEGVALKKKSGADTRFDAAGNLALAQRDAGLVEEALEFFRAGMKLEDIIDPKGLDPVRNGAFYGNVGRCLQFMGQVDSALNCYWKSAKLIEQQADGEHLANQAYIRQWVGELMITKGSDRQGEAFLRAALSKWEFISPPSARALSGSIEALDQRSQDLSPEQCEAAFIKWVDESARAAGVPARG